MTRVVAGPGRRPGLPAALLLLATLAACAGRRPADLEAPATEPSADERARSGGATTVFDASQEAFGFPLANLPATDLRDFFFGNRVFKTDWLVAPASVGSFDGLGPLYNRTSCAGCHVRDGRGRAPADEDERLISMLVRLDTGEVDEHGAPRPHPLYGLQIQERAIPGAAAEARVAIHYERHEVRFPDGEVRVLRRPRVELRDLAFGPLDDVVLSALVAPAVHGVGLLEAVPIDVVREYEDPDDRDGDGLSGRLRRVWSPALGRMAWGRVGWKAQQATLLDQITDALIHDVGITSSVHPVENFGTTPRVDDPRSGGSPEITDDALRRLLFYQRALAVPARRDLDDSTVRQGEALFRRLGCAGCHRSRLTTASYDELPALGGQTIAPYTDLLLHDMGEGLDDGRSLFGATGREWRTPALWGLGLISTVNGHTELLHDGRARDSTEAILWHGGEARVSREAFVRLPRNDRRAVIAFLRSL